MDVVAVESVVALSLQPSVSVQRDVSFYSSKSWQRSALEAEQKPAASAGLKSVSDRPVTEWLL